MSTNPNTVKSQDDINEGGRKSDVLLSTIEELERTKKQLEIAVKALKKYASKIALTYNDGSCYALRYYNDNGREAQKALNDIEELNK